jgi:Zn-finger nucleic acid-binding protein
MLEKGSIPPMRTEAEVAAMACPVCRVPLAMSERQGIEIDYCPQCRGVWLDRGELDKIIERTGPPEETSAKPQPSAPLHQAGARDPWAAGGFDHGGRGHGDHGGYRGKPYKKPKHWLSDLFD